MEDGAAVSVCFGVPSLVGGLAAVAKTLPICSWLRAPLLPSHLIQQEPSPASSSVLRASCSRTSDFRTCRPTPGRLGRETAAADLHRGKRVLFQAWNLEPAVGVCPHHPPSRRPCQAEAFPPGSDAPARLQNLPPAGAAFGSIFNEGDEFPQSSDGWPLFLLKCVRRREALYHV